MEVSKRTGRLRRVTLASQVLATIRATDGRIVLTILGAKRLHAAVKYPRLRATVHQEIAHFIAEGRTLFAKHVEDVDPQLRAGDEVLIVNNKDELLAVGVAQLSPQEMLELTRGVAVKTRHSIDKRKT